MGRGLGACKGKNPEEKGVSTLLMGTFCTVWGPFGTQSHTSPTATALCSGAVALFHAVPAMDTDPYAGYGRNWWIRGFFFSTGFGSFGYLEWQERAPAANSKEKGIPREHGAHQSDAVASLLSQRG